MRRIKGRYIDTMHGLGRLSPIHNFGRAACASRPYGWSRWLASLVAIYDIENMIALDLPWWNVQATSEIESFLTSRSPARIFEWGAGASTVWLARRSGEVVSVEHDANWLDKFEKQAAEYYNVTFLYRAIDDGPDAYLGAIDQLGGQFDLIVIDGRHRVACLQKAIPHLKSDGILVFDDSGRKRYRSGISNCGLTETRHFGRSYCVPFPDYTSLLRHND